jgi:anthranilate phosphoribosyltransferase
MNAAAALVALDDAAGRGIDQLDDAIAAGMERAASSIDSGSAAAALGRWVSATQSRAN